ncbi:MAG: hypothetical protein RLZZ200_1341 [Pseudomonadota bacterium]|jgi:hypothetical protein
MFKPSRGSSVRPWGFVALAAAIGVMAFQASPATARDQADRPERGDRGGDRGRHNQGPDSSQGQSHRQQRQQVQTVQVPPTTAPQAQVSQSFAPSPQAQTPVPRERGDFRDRGESRDRSDFRDRGEYRRPPAAVYAPSPRGSDLRVGPPRNAGPDRSYTYRPRPERIVPRIPPGYREYRWGGMPYYHYGDRWYRPYGGSYVIVSAPFGLFVPYLPAYYSTFWFGGTRYFMADETYYLYDPVRRGYTVTRSPYGNDRDEYEDDDDAVGTSPELFVYPMRGQSEAQQSEDRYQCHRWAADQVHYDPTESEYRAAERAEYDRAMTACLTGRGYSVK